MLYKIAKEISKEIILEKILPVKPTARCPIQYICKIENDRLLVVIAKNKIQKFYLNRSIEKQTEFKNEFGEYYEFNMPLYTGEADDINFVIYPYLENAVYTKNDAPIKNLIAIYNKYARKYDVTDNLIQDIEIDFLSAWPSEFHNEIKQLSLYKKYFNLLKCQKQLSIYKEHGDYTSNNILTADGKYYLVDFEFAKNFQPINIDYFDYCRTAHVSAAATDNPEIVKIKSFLMDDMNDILDYSGYRRSIFHKLALQLRRMLLCLPPPPPQCDYMGAYIDLVDSINDIIDNACIPKITKPLENKFDLVHYIDPNFIYNRFDIMYGDDFELYEIREANNAIYISIHIDRKIAVIGVWLTEISAQGFAILIRTIFNDYPNVNRIQARYSLNYYDGLNISNHWKIELIANKFSLLNKPPHGTRLNIRRIIREFNGYNIAVYSRKEIPQELVERFFVLKKKTHNIDYQMQWDEYLRHFFVSSAYCLIMANEIQAILFTCELDKIVYLENISYNNEYSKYGVGIVLYYHLINDLIERGKTALYLGDGYQEYKRRFCGDNQLVFDGYICRNNLIKIIALIKRILVKVNKNIRKLL